MTQATRKLSSQAFWSLLWTFNLRYWRRHWLKLALLVGIVGLGAGSFLAIGLANRAATRSFDQFAQTVSGQSDIVVTANLGKLSLDDLRSIRLALLESEAALVPQLTSSARVADRNALPAEKNMMTLMGMDLLAASNFLIRHGADTSFWETNANPSERPSGFFCQPGLAARFGWEIGEPVSFFLEDKLVELPWTAPLPSLGTDLDTAAQVLVLDWHTLADLTGRPLRADRVDIVWPDSRFVPDDTPERAVALLEAANPGHWVVESQAQRQATGATMTAALRMNLRALSALSLLVAICLVFQAMDSAVARRQAEVATLRSLGVSTRLTRLLWLADAAFIGILGGGFGLLVGTLMAQVSTRLVAQTVNTLYYNTGDATLGLAPGEAALAFGLTFGFCLLAGWWPARQAARSPLIETMRRGGHRSTYSRKSYAGACLALAILGVLAYLSPPIEAESGHAIPVAGYALALILIALFACLGCLALESVGGLTRVLGSHFPTVRLALSQFRLPVTRHRLALSGVALSVGMTASMIVLIGSFETTVRAWIGNTLQADLFLRSKAVGSMHDDSSLSAELYEKLAEDPRVADIGQIYSSSLRIQNMTTQLVGFDTAYLVRIDHTTWIDAPVDLSELATGQTAIVNEAFANRFDKSVGDAVVVPLQGGEARFRIIGVYADYGNENGNIGIDQARYRELTGDTRPRAIALHVREPNLIAPLARELEAENPAVMVATNRWLREETLRIFNRVFSITYALEAIGLTISVAGLGSMLASLLIERRSETGALIRIGFSRKQTAVATLWEGLALASLGILAGLAIGILLGLVLVFIINRQSFGWTLAIHFPAATLASLCGLTLVGAATVSYFVGRWSASLPLQSEE